MPTLAEILASKASKPAAPAAGLKITPETEKAAKAAEIKAFLDASAPKPSAPAPRELGAMERGERIPMDHPDQEATAEDHAWFSALHCFQSSLCVVVEPGADHNNPVGWIACQSSPHRPPILLFRLPLINRPHGQNPF
jgi:hypothetical protein